MGRRVTSIWTIVDLDVREVEGGGRKIDHFLQTSLMDDDYLSAGMYKKYLYLIQSNSSKFQQNRLLAQQIDWQY